MSRHFAQRVQERIGNVDPDTLKRGILWALEHERWDLIRYIGRVSRCGRRLYAFNVPDGRRFYALVNTERREVITVMPPGFKVNAEGKPPYQLEDAE